MLDILTNFLTYIPFYAYALLLAFVGCLYYRKTCRFSFTEELTVRDNPAFGVCLAGYLLGLVIALAAAFPANAVSPLDAFISMTYSGLLAIVLMRASIYVNGRFILSRFCITDEMLRDRNVGTGFAVAGSSIATGLVLAGVLTGESDSYLFAVRDILLYWALGQGLLIAGAALFSATAGYDVHGSLEHHDNPATGASLGGFLVALGILLGAILRNSSSSIVEELSIALIEVFVGGTLLLLSRFVTERLILPRVNFADEIAVQHNTAAGLISATASIVTALLVAAAVTVH